MLLYGLACLPLIGTLTNARLAKYDGTDRNSTPSFFAFHHTHHHRTRLILFAIINAAGKLLTAILIDVVLVVLYCTTSHYLSLRELR